MAVWYVGQLREGESITGFTDLGKLFRSSSQETKSCGGFLYLMEFPHAAPRETEVKGVEAQVVAPEGRRQVEGDLGDVLLECAATNPKILIVGCRYSIAVGLLRCRGNDVYRLRR